MTTLSSITDLTPEHAELLAAASVRSLGQLARENPVRLHSRMELIAWQRGRGAQPPGLELIEKWVAFAQMTAPVDRDEPLDLDHLPEALPEAASPGIQAWNPPAMRAARETASPSGPATPPVPIPRPQPAPPDNMWRKLDPAKFATIEEYNEGRIGIQPLSRDSLHQIPEALPASSGSDEQDSVEEEAASRRVQRIRGGKGAISRWVKRGVVHPRPVHTWLGALVSLVWRAAMVAGIGGFIYFITHVEKPTDYKLEVGIGAGILLILSMMQLHFAGRSRCRICSCNLYHSKNCLKNSKAHHIAGFGYVASAALHLLIFGWFRCMYCGTAIRLKPSPARER